MRLAFFNISLFEQFHKMNMELYYQCIHYFNKFCSKDVVGLSKLKDGRRKSEKYKQQQDNPERR